MPTIANLLAESNTPDVNGTCSEGCGAAVVVPGWMVDMLHELNRALKRDQQKLIGRSEAIPCDECAVKRRERERWDASRTYWACKQELERIRETKQRPDWQTEQWLRDNGHGNALDNALGRGRKSDDTTL
jgi:hypothetical protein